MNRVLVVIPAMMLLSACNPEGLFGPGEGDVTGTWTATLPGSLFHGEEGAEHTTELTLTLQQNGTQVTGSEGFTDSSGRTGSNQLSGTFVGTILSFTRQDFDSQCGGRQVTSVAWVTAVAPGSTMMIGFGADAAGACPMLTDSLLYTKR